MNEDPAERLGAVPDGTSSGQPDTSDSRRDHTFVFEVVDPASEEAVAAMRAYFAELDSRLDGGFDPGEALTTGLESMRPVNGGTFLIVRAPRTAGSDATGTDPIGTGPAELVVAACGGVQRHNGQTGEIKRMWVNPDCRGLGLGRAMLVELERKIAEMGYTDIVLDTNDVLTEAIAMYERSGYRSIPAYNDNPFARHWFTKPVTQPTEG